MHPSETAHTKTGSNPHILGKKTKGYVTVTGRGATAGNSHLRMRFSTARSSAGAPSVESTILHSVTTPSGLMVMLTVGANPRNGLLRVMVSPMP